MRILIIQGHPDSSRPHLCHALADAYAQGAASAGHDVQTLQVCEAPVTFLRDPEDWKTDLGPDYARAAQAQLLWADHIVMVFPMWMGTMPAMLKGWLEQVARAPFALGNMDKPERKLTGRSIRVIMTMGMPPILYRLYYHAPALRLMRKNIFAMIGIKPMRATLFGLIDSASDAKRQRWLRKVRRLGARAK